MNTKCRFLINAACIASVVMLSSCNDLTKSSEDDKKDPDVVVEYNQASVDSLFSELVDRVETAVENEIDYNLTAELDFKSLASEFLKYSEQGDMKANMGYIVSEMMSLNKSQSLLKVADSLDVFFDNMYGEETVDGGATVTRSGEVSERGGGERIRGIASKLFANREKSDLISRSYSENGINGMATTLLARSPEVILSRAENPSWPTFITVSYIQDIIDNEISPRLANVIKACERMEEKSYGKSLTITVQGETVEIDIADIFLLEASVRTLRSSLNIFTSYEWDVYAPGTTDYSWIKKLEDLGDNAASGYSEYTLKGDTLVCTRYDSEYTDLTDYAYDIFKYNMERSGFLSLKRNNLNSAYSDLLEVPKKLRKAIIALENETDSKENDLIKMADLTSFEGDMVNIEQELLDNGYSNGFAANFATPKTLADFAEKILTGPFQFSESFNGTDGPVSVDVTVDLSKFFTDPIQDFRAYLPLHKFRDKADIHEVHSNVYVHDYSSSNRFEVYNYYYNDEPVVNIPSHKIETDTVDAYGYRTITLKEPFSVFKDVYQYVSAIPYDFTDENGNIITYDVMDELIWEKNEIPYFKDYTLNGIFPGMTREKWNSIVELL